MDVAGLSVCGTVVFLLIVAHLSPCLPRHTRNPYLVPCSMIHRAATGTPIPMLLPIAPLVLRGRSRRLCCAVAVPMVAPRKKKTPVSLFYSALQGRANHAQSTMLQCDYNAMSSVS